MKISDILQFIFSEMQKAIGEKRRERVLELGTAIDVLYEIAISKKDRKTEEILLKLDYVVNHYEDEFSFADESLKDVQQLIARMQNS